MTHKMVWNESNTLPLKLFWWEAPDGSRVLTYFPREYGKEIKPLDLILNQTDAKDMDPGALETMQVYGVGDHGGGPTRNMLDEGLHWMQPDRIYPKLQYTTAISFFDDMAKKVTNPAESAAWNYKTLAAGKTALPAPVGGQISVPVWKDEMYLEFHRGTYTSQAQHKKNMRDSEEWLLNAEKYASLAWLDGQTYPADRLNEAWKKVLFNQFHDLAAGSGIADIYKDAQRDYDVVHWTADEVSATSLNELLAHANTASKPGSVSVAILNPLAWPRTDIVEADVQLEHPALHGVAVTDVNGRALASQVLSSDKVTGR
jgi:alpha-mannosidase